MYITENQTIGDSVLFLLAARKSLAEIVGSSGSENAETLAEFLINEASDYEIMSLLVEGILPEEKYNRGREILLFSRLKESVLMDAASFTEVLGEGNFVDFMTKVDSVYPKFSTQAPVLEFFALQNKEVAVASLLEGSIDPALLHEKFLGFGKTPTEKAIEGGKELISKGVERGTEMATKGWEGIRQAISTAADSASGAASKLVASPAAQGVAAGAVAALLLYASAKTYKRFLSKAARACSGQSGAAKTGCMQDFKAKAKAAQAADLAKAAGACSKAKNPEACKAAIRRKVASLR
jgi:hypothetical protein